MQSFLGSIQRRSDLQGLLETLVDVQSRIFVLYMGGAELPTLLMFFSLALESGPNRDLWGPIAHTHREDKKHSFFVKCSSSAFVIRADKGSCCS